MKIKKELLVEVSVIIPAYNAAAFIQKAIDSALNQTFQNLEVIVVDDGSTDDTVHLIKGYGNKVTLLQQKNSGAAAARNFGAQMAAGKWLAFLDADDLWESDKLEKQMALSSIYSWSYTDSVFFGHGFDGTLKSSDVSPHQKGWVLPVLVVNNFIGTSTVLLNKEVFMAEGGFDPSLKALQDWDLWLKIASKFQLGYVPDVEMKYRVHSKSTSRSARKTYAYHLEIINKTFSSGGVGVQYKYLRHDALAESFGILALISEDANDFTFSIFCAFRSAFYQPKVLYRWKSVARIAVSFIRKYLFSGIKCRS